MLGSMWQPLCVTDYHPARLDDPEFCRWLRNSLGRHLLLVIPGQTFDCVQFVKLASVFGEVALSLDIDTPHPDDQRIQVVERRQATARSDRTPSSHYWHTDRSFLPHSAVATLLHSSILAESGGETQFANGRLALDKMSPTLRLELTRLTARHSYGRYFTTLQPTVYTDEEIAQHVSQFEPSMHPLIQIDPFSGQQSLYLSELCIECVDRVDCRVSSELLLYLYERVTSADCVYTHRWTPGDILIWNNCGLMHRACHSTGHRILYRAVVTRNW